MCAAPGPPSLLAFHQCQSLVDTLVAARNEIGIGSRRARPQSQQRHLRALATGEQGCGMRAMRRCETDQQVTRLDGVNSKQAHTMPAKSTPRSNAAAAAAAGTPAPAVARSPSEIDPRPSARARRSA